MENRNEKREYVHVNISLQSIVAAVILSAMFFLLIFNWQKTYVSSYDVLVIPKSPLVAKNEGYILANMQEFPKLLSFYDALLKNNPNLTDFATGKSQQQRKQLWDSIVSVQKINPDASILQISVTAGSGSDSQLLAQTATRELIDTASQYYNIKTDIDFRIVEGPIGKVEIAGLWWIFPLSLLLGIISSALLEVLVVSMGKISVKEKNPTNKKEEIPETEIEASQDATENHSYFDELYKSEELDVPFSFDQYAKEEKDEPQPPMKELDEINEHLQKSVYPNFPEMPVTYSQTSSAPDNLPVANSFNFPAEKPAAEIKNDLPVLEEKSILRSSQSEPTEEELKERLNQLLKGQL